MFFYEDARDSAAGKSRGARTFGSPQFVAQLADYASAMGVSRNLIYMAEKVDPDHIHIVTPGELRRWRLGRETY